MLVDLDRLQGRSFVNAYLDTFPDKFKGEIREQFFQATGGNALFSVELLRDLQSNGYLKCDKNEFGVENYIQKSGHIPERIKTVFEIWVSQLSPTLKDILNVACVDGYEFSAEVIANVRGLSEQKVLKCFSETLSREYNLVYAHRVTYTGSHRLSHYCFRHGLLRDYLYEKLDVVQRTHLHKEIGTTLEQIYQENKSFRDIHTMGLAGQFEAAGMVIKAAEYYLRAGHQAMCLHTSREARLSFQRGLDLFIG